MGNYTDVFVAIQTQTIYVANGLILYISIAMYVASWLLDFKNTIKHIS